MDTGEGNRAVSDRWTQEKAIEQSQELYIVVIDFRKAFDTVDRTTLWKILRVFGRPHRFVKIVSEFHAGFKGRVVSEEMQMNHGTKQGCVLAPTLFTLFLTLVLMVLHQIINEGVYIRTRGDIQSGSSAR